MQRTAYPLIIFVVLVICSQAACALPALELVDQYHGDINLDQYWVSEKYDGVRGYWDGHQLLTRGGNPINAPSWFTNNWPTRAMDGELWAGYGNFSQASAIIRSAQPNDSSWQRISYRVFDLPDHKGTFDQRVPLIQQRVKAINQPWVIAIKQFHVASKEALFRQLNEVVAKGGEGLVLHRGDTLYRAGRGVGLLKLKPYQDAEAIVIGLNPGNGRLEGKMGSLRVRTQNQRVFSIGTGFTDAERANPPPIGSWITFRFNGRTATGLPRFARFLRRRPGGPPPEATNNSAK